MFKVARVQQMCQSVRALRPACMDISCGIFAKGEKKTRIAITRFRGNAMNRLLSALLWNSLTGCLFGGAVLINRDKRGTWTKCIYPVCKTPICFRVFPSPMFSCRLIFDITSLPFFLRRIKTDVSLAPHALPALQTSFLVFRAVLRARTRVSGKRQSCRM